jgi:hypothetical protein
LTRASYACAGFGTTNFSWIDPIVIEVGSSATPNH